MTWKSDRRKPVRFLTTTEVNMPFYLQLILAFLLGMLFTWAYVLVVTRNNRS